MKIKITGVEEIVEDLEGMLSEAQIERNLQKACLVIERSAKQKVRKKSGDLARSITSEVEGNKGIVFTPLEYAPYVEFGTGIHAEGGNGRKTPWFIPIGHEFTLADAERYKMLVVGDPDKQQWAMTRGAKPHPYMRPALLENREQIMRILREGLLDD